jgi:hypothetical protein
VKRALKPYLRRNAKIRQEKLAFSYPLYLRTPLWKRIRERVLNRDNHTCRICGNRATQAHHTNYCRKTLTGQSITGIFAICGPCHQFIEFNRDGSKAHLFLEVRKRILLLARLKGRQFIWPGDERRPCRQCQRPTGLPSLGDDGICKRCHKQR